MLKKIKIDSKHSVELNSSAGWLLIYRAQFGKDILPDILPAMEALMYALAGLGINEETGMIEEIDIDIISDMFTPLSGLEIVTMLNCFWAMAKNANEDIDPPMEFLNQFKKLPIDTVTQEVMALIGESCLSRKNWESLKSLMDLVANWRQRISSSQELSEDLTGEA